MFKLAATGLALVLCVGTAGLISGKNKQNTVDARLAADGAYRDGLYMGRLAAQSGRPLRPVTGRWSTSQDRASFAAGYTRGHNEALASAKK